jgi:hypothetical protein
MSPLSSRAWRCALMLSLVVPATSAAAQALVAQLSPEDEKIASDQKKAANRAKKSEPFYTAPSVFEFKLTTNIRRIRSDKEDKAPWRAATLSYTDADGKQVEIPSALRTRGIWRLKNCEFPPLRMNFTSEATKNTLLEGVDKPKLVNFCENTDAYEQLIMQEMQLYRIYSVLTPASHRARLARITYADSASGKTHATRIAIIVEEPEVMAARIGGSLVETKGATANDLSSYQDVLASVFQYMIGNTDWSTYGLHNMELVRQANGDHIPIPYDFDFAGAIDAPYASVDPKLRINRVRQRVYRGYCYPAEEFEKVFTVFNEKKPAIYSLYADAIGSKLSKRTVDLTLKYFDEFYETINDPRKAKSRIIDACLKS